MTALEIGCREGYQTLFLETKGYQVTSIDIEKKMPDCVVMNANIKLKFADNNFDLIWCSEVLEHLKNPEFSINEFKRVLKPDGKMIFTTPNSYFWIFKLFNLFGLSPQKLQRKDHINFFSKNDINILFPEATIYGFFPYYIFKFKIKKLVGILSPTFIILSKLPKKMYE